MPVLAADTKYHKFLDANQVNQFRYTVSDLPLPPDQVQVSVTVKITSQENGKHYNVHFRIFIAVFFAQMVLYIFVIFF